MSFPVTPTNTPTQCAFRAVALRWSVVVISFLLAPQLGLAQRPEQSANTRQLVSIAINPSFELTRAGRAIFVKLLSDYCGEVLNALPTNTPSEDAWVVSESKTSDSHKIDRLVRSPEWGRRMFKEDFSTCRETTLKIIEAQANSRRTEQSLRYEAASLISLAYTFNGDKDDLNLYATRAGLPRERFALDFLGSVRRTLLAAALRTLEERSQ